MIINIIKFWHCNFLNWIEWWVRYFLTTLTCITNSFFMNWNISIKLFYISESCASHKDKVMSNAENQSSKMILLLNELTLSLKVAAWLELYYWWDLIIWISFHYKDNQVNNLALTHHSSMQAYYSWLQLML